MSFPDLPSGFYWYTHLVGMAVSLLCAVLGSLHGARAMLRLQPAAAMRPEPPRRGRRIWLERLGTWWARLSTPWRMTLRGIFRHRLRTLAGMFAAAMGAGLLVTGFMMTEIQIFLIEFQFHEILRSDIDLAFESERSEAALDEVRQLPGVDCAEPMFNVACTFQHGPYRRKAGVTGLQQDARLTIPRDKQRRAIAIPDAGIVLTDRLADILHAQAGDIVTIVPIKGERRPIEVPVAQVSESYFGLAAYAEIDYLSRVVDGEFTMTGAQLSISGDPADLDTLYRTLKSTPASNRCPLGRI